MLEQTIGIITDIGSLLTHATDSVISLAVLSLTIAIAGVLCKWFIDALRALMVNHKK